MATTHAYTLIGQGVIDPGTRYAIIEWTIPNNYSQNKTIDLSTTNTDSVTDSSGKESFLGFSTIKYFRLNDPHTPAGALGYRSHGLLNTTTLTATLAIVYGDYSQSSDGPLVQFPASALMDSMKARMLILGN